MNKTKVMRVGKREGKFRYLGVDLMEDGGDGGGDRTQNSRRK